MFCLCVFLYFKIVSNDLMSLFSCSRFDFKEKALKLSIGVWDEKMR